MCKSYEVSGRGVVEYMKAIKEKRGVVSVRMPLRFKREVEGWAKERMVSVGVVVREALKRYMGKKELGESGSDNREAD